jgi:hypothetical protein
MKCMAVGWLGRCLPARFSARSSLGDGFDPVNAAVFMA